MENDGSNAQNEAGMPSMGISFPSFSPYTVLPPQPPRPRTKIAPMSKAGRAEAMEKRRTTEEQIRQDLNKWYQDTVNYTNAMAVKHGKGGSHYMRLCFKKGNETLNERMPNTYNAFLSFKSEELGGGKWISLICYVYSLPRRCGNKGPRSPLPTTRRPQDGV